MGTGVRRTAQMPAQLGSCAGIAFALRQEMPGGGTTPARATVVGGQAPTSPNQRKRSSAVHRARSAHVVSGGPPHATRKRGTRQPTPRHPKTEASGAPGGTPRTLATTPPPQGAP
ncbi:hypothetical protein GCM10027072_51040 [Streptomyces bullii]